jgi:AraC-like DNA-binding protein
MRALASMPTRRRAPRPLGLALPARRPALGARARRPRAPQRPLLVTKEEAARALGMSISHFQRHVQSQIKCVYSGQLSLYHWRDLERWAEEEATIGGRRA